MIKSISKIFLVSLIGMLVFTSLPQRSAVAQSVDDETLIHQTIDAYFNLKYEARADLNPKAFGQLIASTAQAQKFLRDELDRREIEYHRASLFNLGYLKYSYTLDYQSTQVDLSKGTASVVLIEGHDVVFNATAPNVSQMAGLEHNISLIKVKDEWIIVEDIYADNLVRVMNSGVTKAQLIQMNIGNHRQVTAEQKAYATTKAPPPRPMSGHSYNKGGAASYAYTWWSSYNTAEGYQNLSYATYGDCANFVSQAMHETNPGGGIPESTPVPGYGWWVEQFDDGSPPDHGPAWTGAHWIRDWILGTYNDGPEGYQQSAASYLSYGDLIDYEQTCDVYYDHVVMVTLNQFPNVYVASHTPNLYGYPYTYFYWCNHQSNHISYLVITGW